MARPTVKLMHPAPGLTAADERRRVPDPDPGWSDIWSFDFATAGAELGGFIRLTLLPHRRTCWYWAWIVGEGRQPVMVVDNDVPLPPGQSLELRTEGLWADHTVEVPFDHVTLGCEAFALRLDDPNDALAPNPVGDRVPFGLDLEWETDGPVHPRAGTGSESGYAISCRVHGLVLVADEQITLDATGYRHHTWGTPNWSTPWTTSPGSQAVEPVVEAPVLVPYGDGRISRFTRTLCRLTGESIRSADAGWIEKNEPT
jgi:hypothetical protein